MISVLYAVVMLAIASQVGGDKADLRVVAGFSAGADDYPFILSLQVNRTYTDADGKQYTRLQRYCSGSLIKDQWVLTAGQCLVNKNINTVFVRYGDMTLPEDKAEEFYKKTLRMIPHPGYLASFMNVKEFSEDIGLLMTESMPIEPAKVSAYDYVTLIGLPVTYGGFGMTKYFENLEELKTKPLKIGEGGIVPCPQGGIQLCVVPKCNKNKEYTNLGDSGGPLLFENKIIGVNIKVTRFRYVRKKRKTMSTHTPVSVNLDWITSVLKEIAEEQTPTDLPTAK